VEFLGEFFMVYDINIHESNLRPFKDLKFLDEISFKKFVFFAFLNNKYIIYIFKGKNLVPYQRGGDFIDGHYIIFSIFFCLAMFHEPKNETLWPLENYKLYIVCTLILSNHFYLTIGSRLILIQSEL